MKWIIEKSMRSTKTKTSKSVTLKASETVTWSHINYKKFGQEFKCAMQPLVDAVIAAVPDDLHVVNASVAADPAIKQFVLTLELSNGTQWNLDLSALYDSLNQQLDTDAGSTLIEITDWAGNVVNSVDVCPLVELCIQNNGLPVGTTLLWITDWTTTQAIWVGDTVEFTSTDGSATVTVSAPWIVDITVPACTYTETVSLTPNTPYIVNHSLNSPTTMIQTFDATTGEQIFVCSDIMLWDNNRVELTSTAAVSAYVIISKC